MLRYKLKTKSGEVRLALDSEQPQKVAPLQYEGEGAAVLAVKRWLHYTTGSYGQRIGDWTAPIDLKHAMASDGAKPFAPELVEESMGMKKPSDSSSDGGG